MNTREIKSFVASLRLNQRQRAILPGLLLGDGHLETRNGGQTYRLKIEHSSGQREYVDWLYEAFQNHVRTGPRVKKQRLGDKTYEKYLFNTLSTGSLRFYGQQFYPKGKKQVPKIISHLLTPLGLAVWFMDDGSFKSKDHRALILNTQGFTRDEVDRLRQVLLDKFSVRTIRRPQKEGDQIYILADQVARFVEIIRPHLLPSMEYKIRRTSLPKL